MSGKEIPIVYITDDNFVMQTCTSIESLFANKKPNTEYSVYVVMAEASKESCDVLARYDHVVLLQATLEKYRNIRQLAHIPIACLLKFDLCDLLCEYDKLLYLDGDTIVLDDLSRLYDVEIKNAYAGAVLSMRSVWDEKRINAGVMLFNAKKMRDDNMSQKLTVLRESLNDRASMDQQSFNLLLGSCMQHLPVQYNYMPMLAREIKRKYSIDQINGLYNTSYCSYADLEKNAVIVHFASDEKPWKYTHIPFADVWDRYYAMTAFADNKLIRHGKWWLRKKRLVERIRKNGFRSMLIYCRGVFERRVLKKMQKSNWG